MTNQPKLFVLVCLVNPWVKTSYSKVTHCIYPCRSQCRALQGVGLGRLDTGIPGLESCTKNECLLLSFCVVLSGGVYALRRADPRPRCPTKCGTDS
jgi:hypothetical protein